jgi:hypothetical protein
VRDKLCWRVRLDPADLVAAMKSIAAEVNDPPVIDLSRKLAEAGSRKEMIELLTAMRSIAEAAKNSHKKG